MSRACHWSVAFAVLAMAIVTNGCSSAPISVSLSPSSPQAIDQSQTIGIKATLANEASGKGVSWKLAGPGTLSNPTGFSVTYNSPTQGITSPQQATVTATSVADQSKSASVQVTVNPYPQIPFQVLTNGTEGAPYSQTIKLTGGTTPFRWTVYDGPIPTGWRVGGAVPDGLALNANTGTISGTPTGGGTWYFEATATDATGVTVDNGFLSIQINSSASATNPVPFLNQPVVPTATSPGSADFTLNVSGTGFVSGATIDFNNASLATTFVDSRHLSAVVPAGDVATAGTDTITVVNPTPGGGPSNGVYFQVGDSEAAVNFVNAPNSPLQIPGFAIAVADFNADGKVDLAIAGGIRLYVMLGNGDGTFAPATGSPMPVPSPPYNDFGSPYTGPAMTVGDFNHSGHPGLAVGLFQSGAAAILFGNGDGTFAYSSTLANTEGAYLMSLTAADFNADGNLDLIATNSINGISPPVLLGYSQGAFNGITLDSIQVLGVSSAAGDFNGDSKLDLVIDGATILLGNGDGTFTQGASLDTSGGAVTAADFNGDGKLDLAVCNPDKNSVTILLGNGDGTFTTASGSPIPVGSQPWAIVAGDFNDDEKLDLAIVNNGNGGDGTVAILLGNGDGTFTQASGSPYAVGQSPDAIAAADFNGDGKLDLAVANSDGTVSILLQQ